MHNGRRGEVRVRIGMGQARWAGGDMAANDQQIGRYAREASAAGCDVLLLPELCDTGYVLAEMPVLARQWAEGGLSDWQALARQHGIGLIAGVAEREGECLYNSSVMIDRMGVLCGLYRKTHLFCGPEGDEGAVFTAGNRLEVSHMAGACWGVSICFDLRFPEVYRTLASAGAQILVVVAAWPAVRIADWQRLCRARAMENQVFLVGVNQTGISNGIPFGGGSCVVAPDGSELAGRAGDGETLLIADLVLDR